MRARLVQVFGISVLVWAQAVSAQTVAPCLDSQGSLIEGDTHEIVLTALGRRLWDEHVKSLSPRPDPTKVVPVVRISSGPPDAIAGFSSNERTTLKTNLAAGTYTVRLEAALHGWPETPTAFSLVDACEAMSVTVRARKVGEWSPNPQVFLEGPNQLGLGGEAYVGRWGVAAVMTPRWKHLDESPHARVEVRRSATRGYLAAGIRLTQRDLTERSVTLSGAIELPPFRRMPLWAVADVHASTWDGSWEGWRWATVRSQVRGVGHVLKSFSLRLRVDMRRVWR
jgi:hypothetical protein